MTNIMPRLVRRRRPVRRLRRKGRKMRRMIPKRSMNANKDRATVTEVYQEDTIDGNAFTSGNTNFSLSEFPRALAVSKHYRYYRATKMTIEFIPYANVYAVGQSFPELYIQKDYTTQNANQLPATVAQFQSRGVLPLRWTSPIKRTVNPAVLRIENLQVQAWKDANEFYINEIQPLTSTPVRNKWYMTEASYQATQYTPNQNVVTNPIGPSANPTTLLYHGVTFGIDTPIANQAVVGKILVKVAWEFKEPFVAESSPNAPAPQLVN